jgi:hypothetical protein
MEQLHLITRIRFHWIFTHERNFLKAEEILNGFLPRLKNLMRLVLGDSDETLCNLFDGTTNIFMEKRVSLVDG